MTTEERIVKKAHELFMRFGIRSVSMDEIASQLGMSKKTIYHYYKDKDALVDGVLNIEMNEKECQCTSTQQGCKNAVHEIFLTMDYLEGMFAGFNPSILYDLEKFHPNSFLKFTEHHNLFLYGIIKNNLEKGIAEGNYRLNINTDIVAKYRIGTMFMIFNTTYFPLGKYSLATLCMEITDNFLHGLVTPQGKELIDEYKKERIK